MSFLAGGEGEVGQPSKSFSCTGFILALDEIPSGKSQSSLNRLGLCLASERLSFTRGIGCLGRSIVAEKSPWYE